MLFAHHLEPQHFPVLLCLFAAGCYIGWHVVSRLVTRPAMTFQSSVARSDDTNIDKAPRDT